MINDIERVLFTEEELSVLRSDENGIEYVIEESTNSSRIYHCHLSENTKTQKTYVSRTFTGQNGSVSFILIRVDLSGSWYQSESTYKGFLTPTAADSGKVIAAGWLGKIKTVLQMSAVIGLLLLTPVTGPALLGRPGMILADVAMYAATVMTLWSGVDYIVKNKEILTDW